MSLTDKQLLEIIGTINQSKIGGKTTVSKISGTTLGVTARAYTAGQVLGTGNPVPLEVLTSPNGTAILYSAIIGDVSKGNGAINMTFFSDSPSATTITNGSALDIAIADIPKVLGTYSIAAADYVDYSTHSIATKSGSGFALQNDSATAGDKGKIWVVFTANDSKTYTAGNISANIGLLLD